VRAEEVYAHGLEVLAEVGTADLAGVRGGDQAVRVELADQLPEFLEVGEAREALVLDVPFVGQVQVPVAVGFQARDERFDGPAVGLQGLEPGGAGRAVPARERHVDHDALLVAGGHQALEPLQGRLAGLAFPVHRRDVLAERRSGRPDADPVEAVLLEVREVTPDGLVGGAERPVVADTGQEGRPVVDGEARPVGAQARNGLCPAPGQTSCGEGADGEAGSEQGGGARPFDVSWPVDAVLGVGFKWLCGPYGTGFLWVRPDLLRSLNATQAYWLAQMTAADLGREEVAVRLPSGPPTARTFDVFGTANFFNFKPWAAASRWVGIRAVPREHQFTRGK
jgi:hypothetical protein